MQASRRDGITFNLPRVALLPATVVELFENQERHFEGLRQNVYLYDHRLEYLMVGGQPTAYGRREYHFHLLACVSHTGGASISQATPATDEIAQIFLTISLKSVLHENPTGQILITPVYAYPVKGFASTIKQRYYLYWTKS